MQRINQCHVKTHKLRASQLDELVTSISQAIYRDLSVASTEVAEGPQLSFVINRQRRELLKKFPFSAEDSASLEKLTLNKFLSVNEHMASFRNVKFPEPTCSVFKAETQFDKIMLRARALMHSTLFDFDEDEFFHHCKHSGGSSIGVPFSDTSIERKFAFPLSITKEVVPLFERYMSYNFQLKEAVESFNSLRHIGEIYSIVEGSRATTVAKDDTIRRMIAIEPTANMFMQQGLMSMMYDRMKRVGLNVESLPEEHVHLAWKSSITSEMATIDFSSASDCVSIELLRWLLPPKWFLMVDRVRCKRMSVNGTYVQLNMASTMGNAVTFPLETLVFWTIAHACRLSLKRSNTLLVKYEDLKCCSVFGDDCILPRSVAPLFMEVTKRIGFIVNDDKSFYGTEQFRESCGGDFLAGYDVRPFFLKGPTSTKPSALEAWLYIVMNSVLKKYIQYFGTLTYLYEKNFLRLMYRTFSKYNFRLKIIPEFYPDDAGLKISADMLRFLRCYSFPVSPVKRTDQGGYTFYYKRFVYRTKYRKDAGIRYSLWLNRPSVSKEPPNPFVSIRRIGGYVVAKGYTAHWAVPE